MAKNASVSKKKSTEMLESETDENGIDNALIDLSMIEPGELD